MSAAAGIDYRERSPLVIPPTLDLPPPEAADAAARNPAWPRDPERKVAVTRTRNTRATPDEPGSESATDAGRIAPRRQSACASASPIRRRTWARSRKPISAAR